MIDVEYKELVLVSKEDSVNKIRIMYWYVSDVFSQVAEEYLWKSYKTITAHLTVVNWDMCDWLIVYIVSFLVLSLCYVNSYAKGHKETRAYQVHEADPTKVMCVCFILP